MIKGMSHEDANECFNLLESAGFVPQIEELKERDVDYEGCHIHLNVYDKKNCRVKFIALADLKNCKHLIEGKLKPFSDYEPHTGSW